jgi:hypothetical protein
MRTGSLVVQILRLVPPSRPVRQPESTLCRPSRLAPDTEGMRPAPVVRWWLSNEPIPSVSGRPPAMPGWRKQFGVPAVHQRSSNVSRHSRIRVWSR